MSDVFVLLRACDAIDYHFRLPDGKWHTVRYAGDAGNDGLPQPITALPLKEANKLMQMGVAVRFASQEEHDHNTRSVQAQREIAGRDKH